MSEGNSNGRDPLADGWIWATIGDVTDVIRGASPRPKGDPEILRGRHPLDNDLRP